MIERCIRDREGRIVGYPAGYSDKELQHLLQEKNKNCLKYN